MSGTSGVNPLDARAARVTALDSLARRDRPREDLRRKLLKKGYDPAVVGDVLERLCAEKLIDDRRYAENFVGFHGSRGQGPRQVRLKLRNLGLEGPLVETAIDAYPDWQVQLVRAREKKFGAQRPTLYAEQQRQARFLSYRGFTSAQIRIALGFDYDLDLDT